MHKNNTSRLSPGRKTLLAVAVAATLLNDPAHAVTHDIDSSTWEVVWQDGDLNIAPGITVSGSGSAAVRLSGTTLGTLTNNGMISAPTPGITTGATNSAVTIDKIINNAATAQPSN